MYNLPDGTYHLVATHVGYNDSDPVEVTVVDGSTANVNFTLTAPNITVTPLIFDETLHPNEYLTTYLSLLNTGDGIWNWGATVVYPSSSRETTQVSFDVNSLPSNWDGVINTTTGAFSSISSNGGQSEMAATRDDILMYDDGINANAIGLTSGGTFEVSSYWPSSTMSTYAGQYVKEVEIYANDLSADFAIKIYGEGTSSSAGPLLYAQAFVPPAAGWFTVILATPVEITGDDMWIGYECGNSVAGGHPAGMDGGPAVAGYGDMIYADFIPGWASLSSFGFSNNWNIHTLVGPVSGPSGWLTLDQYSGYVQPGGGTVNIATNFNAAGTAAGEVYHADIIITSNPDVGTIDVPVTMTIAGDPFPTVDDFAAQLTNDVTGEVTMNWIAPARATLDHTKFIVTALYWQQWMLRQHLM